MQVEMLAEFFQDADVSQAVDIQPLHTRARRALQIRIEIRDGFFMIVFGIVMNRRDPNLVFGLRRWAQGTRI
jgi:hypothetical protein